MHENQSSSWRHSTETFLWANPWIDSYDRINPDKSLAMVFRYKGFFDSKVLDAYMPEQKLLTQPGILVEQHGSQCQSTNYDDEISVSLYPSFFSISFIYINDTVGRETCTP